MTSAFKVIGYGAVAMLGAIYVAPMTIDLIARTVAALVMAIQ